MELTKRRSRFQVEPRGDGFRLTPHKLAVLQLLQRYRYLPTKYIHAFVGGDFRYVQDMLTTLRHEGRLIDARWAGHNALKQQAVYFLTRAGERALKEHGLFSPVLKTGSDFAHELGVCLVQASFELGAKEHGLRLITPREILELAPFETRKLKEPFAIPVTYEFPLTTGTKRLTSTVESDGDFFGIAGKKATLYVPGFEMDRVTEVLETDDFDRPSIRRKFFAYRQLARDRAWEKRFNLPNVLIPFVTTKPSHMSGMMRALDRVTNGKGSKLFIFKVLPDYTGFANFPDPTGHMLGEPWHRVGHPPVNLLAELKGGDV